MLEGANVQFSRKSFKKMFPKLAEEMEFDENKVDIESVRTDAETGEDAASKRFVHYQPDAIDFIRRCDSEEQAEEIVAYLEKRGEIQKAYASRLRKQLREKGVRSFGPKKEQDYYLKHGEQ